MRSRQVGVSSFVIIFLVLLAVGAVALVNRPEKNEFRSGIGGGPESVQTDSVTAIQQRKKINIILQEHVAIGAIHLQNLYDGKDTSDSKLRMDKNTSDLIDLVANISGNFSLNAQNDFRRVWLSHMDMYESYTLALKNNDEEGKTKVRDSINDIAKEFGDVASKILPNVSAQDAGDAMAEHMDLTLSIIEAHASGNEDTKITQAAEASTQASRFSEILIP